MHELPRERKFSETDSQYCATLCTRTGAKRPFAPVEYPSSRHLDTPSHKNSLGGLQPRRTGAIVCLQMPSGARLKNQRLLKGKTYSARA